MNRKYQRHGLRQTPEYTVWSNMKNRVLNPKCKEYPYYGGRGITVCPEWIECFIAFYNHVGPRPTPKHSLDRYPNKNGNYEPGNVRWATRSEQMLNRNGARMVTVGGVTLHLEQWATRKGVYKSTLLRRVKRGVPEHLLFVKRVKRHKIANAAQSNPESKPSTETKTAKGAN